MFPLSLRVHSLRMRDIQLKGKDHTYCMSATGPPCIKLSCFSMIAAIGDIILSNIRLRVSALRTALEAADGEGGEH